MRTAGTLILEDIVEPTLIREAREAFVQRYDRYLDGREHDDALQVGNRRLMITVDLEPPFERRELIANPWLCPILSAAFQGEFVLAAYGVVCSMPGASRQSIHQDGGDIFPQAGLNRLLPSVRGNSWDPTTRDERDARDDCALAWVSSWRNKRFNG
jgi:hypothetical protein